MAKLLTYIVIFFVALSSSLNVQAQSNKEQLEVERLATQMFIDVNNKDYEAIMAMSHPKIFEMVPKESLIELFIGMFEGNDQYQISIPNTIPDHVVSKISTDEASDTDYSFISYDMKMNMTFKNESFDDEAKETMRKMMEVQGMNVTFVSDNSLDVTIPNSLTMLIKAKNTNDKWVMINYDPDSPLFYQVLPKALIEEARDYKQNLMLESSKN